MILTVLSVLVKGILGLLLAFVIVALVKLYVRHALWRWDYNYSGNDHQPKGTWGWTKALIATIFWLPCDIVMFIGSIAAIIIAMVLCSTGAVVAYSLFFSLDTGGRINQGRDRRVEADAMACDYEGVYD